VDNDPAAAMRYTEARLTPLAFESLLADIRENTVDFQVCICVCICVVCVCVND